MKNQKVNSKSILEQINERAAAIDVGSLKHYVAVNTNLTNQSIRTYGCYTSDLRQLAEWLKSLGIQTVAIESTGVYWLGIYLMLEAYDIEVCLVNASHVKNVPGRKTDVQDCQWLQQLHSYGLLRASFQPDLMSRQLRDYVRQRQRLVKEQSRNLLQMQKAMDQMNIKLHEVISDISGKSGMAIIQAILNGERDRNKLAQLADRRVKKSKEEIAKALEGFWQPANLFELEQAYERYNFLGTQVSGCDEKIEQTLEEQKRRYGKKSNSSQYLQIKTAEKKRERESMNQNFV